jgi:hypothetical protein
MKMPVPDYTAEFKVECNRLVMRSIKVRKILEENLAVCKKMILEHSLYENRALF